MSSHQSLVKKYNFDGLVLDMEARKVSKNKKKQNNFESTVFTIAVPPMEQKAFEEMIREILFEGHSCSIEIKTKTQDGSK